MRHDRFRAILDPALSLPYFGYVHKSGSTPMPFEEATGKRPTYDIVNSQ